MLARSRVRNAQVTAAARAVRDALALYQRHPTLAYAREGLMHDAAEAYCLDMPRPLKYLPGMSAYREIEHRIQLTISGKFGLALDVPESVKHIDVALLMTEREHLLWPQTKPWDREVAPLEIPDFDPWSPERAKKEFLDRFWCLERKRPGYLRLLEEQAPPVVKLPGSISSPLHQEDSADRPYRQQFA